MSTLPGCFLLPVYHQPQGFSSTYYRHLQQSAQMQQSAMLPTVSPTGPSLEPTPPAPQAAEATPDRWWTRIGESLTRRPESAETEADE